MHLHTKLQVTQCSIGLHTGQLSSMHLGPAA